MQSDRGGCRGIQARPSICCGYCYYPQTLSLLRLHMPVDYLHWQLRVCNTVIITIVICSGCDAEVETFVNHYPALITRQCCTGMEPHSALPVAMPMVFSDHCDQLPKGLRGIKILAHTAASLVHCQLQMHASSTSSDTHTLPDQIHASQSITQSISLGAELLPPLPRV